MAVGCIVIAVVDVGINVLVEGELEEAAAAEDIAEGLLMDGKKHWSF